MTRIEKRYQALRIKQTSESEWLVLFSANSCEINNWAGVPQKTVVEGTETTGFQRDVKKERLNSLINFYSNKKNVIQNPLLCAYKSIDNCSISFEANHGNDDNIQQGVLKIEYEDNANKTLLELLIQVKKQLEDRIPDLKNTELDQELLKKIKINFDTEKDDENDQDDISNETNEKQTEDTLVSIEETHIEEFWQEISCRAEVLGELNDSDHIESVNGFSKEVLLDYLKPVVIVDGQHRLKGAIATARFEANSLEESKQSIADAIVSGRDEDEALEEQMYKYARHLPISLIMNKDPAEHVFQFVVVNQKATPINQALLGTIVSTTLSNEELQRVETRLEEADIPLEDSRSISFATRNPESPFNGLVQTGISGEEKNKLQWNVMRSLITIIKELKGGKPYHESVDYANLWKKNVLFATDYSESDDYDHDTSFEYWSSDKGLWREFFITFWAQIRDYFANTDDEASGNYWGSTTSNLFNKVSLTILISDYFKYIDSKDYELKNKEDISKSISGWLKGVDQKYFSRDWKLLKGVKKDSPAIRKQWSKIWYEYRVDASSSLPAVKKYSQPYQ